MSRAPNRPTSRSTTTRAAAAISPAKIITDAIIARLEAGVSPWRKPWAANTMPVSRPLRACGTPYRGINVLWLWAVAENRGYTNPLWMTYQQAQSCGGQVRKGERGSVAVFYKSYISTQTDDSTGEESTGQRRVLKAYTVFNVEQIDNLPERFALPTSSSRNIGDDAHRAEIDAFLAASGARIVHGGDVACYRPVADLINLPHSADFHTYADYGATAAHELAHWTGHPSRLNRDLQNRFGSDKYAAEELIAEFASALIGADLGLPVTHLDSHASYIGHWLKILRSDDRALLHAAARAEDAAGYLLARAGRIDGEINAASDADADIEPRALAA